MTGELGQAINRAARQLAGAGVTTPGLDAQLLMAHVMGADRTFVLARMADALPSDTKERFNNLVERRQAREPVAYITGHREFYSITFRTDKRALLPRPETETLIDSVLSRYAALSSIRALDIGCGCGVIAITLALHRPRWEMTALDISPGAIELASENVRLHCVEHRVNLIRSDLFESAPAGLKFDLIVSNPPYVEQNHPGVSPEADLYEPATALYSGPDGLGAIRKIIEQADGWLTDKGRIVLEIGYGQAGAVSHFFEKNGYQVEQVIPDLAGVDRVIVAGRK